MKRNLGWMGALALGLVGLLNAQSSETLKAEIPFAFHVSNHEMLAGKYLVKALAPQYIRVVSAEAKDSAFVPRFAAIAVKAPGRARLVFNKYPNGRYFLSQIWHEGLTTGSEVFKSKLEREMVTSTLQAGMRPVRVVVLAYISW